MLKRTWIDEMAEAAVAVWDDLCAFWLRDVWPMFLAVWFFCIGASINLRATGTVLRKSGVLVITKIAVAWLVALLAAQLIPEHGIEAGLLAAHPEVAGPHLTHAVDTIVRVVLSHVVQPGPPPDLRWLGDRLLG